MTNIPQVRQRFLMLRIAIDFASEELMVYRKGQALSFFHFHLVIFSIPRTVWWIIGLLMSLTCPSDTPDLNSLKGAMQFQQSPNLLLALMHPIYAGQIGAHAFIVTTYLPWFPCVFHVICHLFVPYCHVGFMVVMERMGY
ncbi:hypothetical protein BDZ91DRAFT_355106 [Kalaharituber pfeilii]|nr:hypothetical protein BDZ91DRAFT_355106 [Kalaharituber pfeilii]